MVASFKFKYWLTFLSTFYNISVHFPKYSLSDTLFNVFWSYRIVIVPDFLIYSAILQSFKEKIIILYHNFLFVEPWEIQHLSMSQVP